MEIFDLSPTAYEVARGKRNRMTPKQRQREGQKQLKIALGQVNRKHAPAVNHNALKLARCICGEYGINEPLIVKCLLPLHEAAQMELLTHGHAEQEAGLGIGDFGNVESAGS